MFIALEENKYSLIDLASIHRTEIFKISLNKMRFLILCEIYPEKCEWRLLGMILEFVIQKINFSPVYVIIRIPIYKDSLQAGVCMKVQNKIQFQVLKKQNMQACNVLFLNSVLLFSLRWNVIFLLRR
jgi:hypothetical protein